MNTPQASETSGNQSSPVPVQGEEEALERFTEYFVRNYPGPDTIIHDPKWHAPKIFRAAKHALAAALSSPLQEREEDEQETYQIGYRDGYEKAIQDADLRTGGDGEYFASTIPGRGCPDSQTMLKGISERFAALSFPDKPVESDLETLQRSLLSILTNTAVSHAERIEQAMLFLATGGTDDDED